MTDNAEHNIAGLQSQYMKNNYDVIEHSTVAPWNASGNASDTSPQPLVWGALGLTLVIMASAVGNVLVCLAVSWERRLQNMTNYFLMSLAIADLLVSVLVMPLGMVVELYGYFPLPPGVCVLWATMDVLMCTASIWHMCTMSMDRFFTLKYPMKYGRNKTKKMVALKITEIMFVWIVLITFVWVVSIFICSPVFIQGYLDYKYVYNQGLCVPKMRNFVIYGSVFAFYVPFTIMIVTYVLTIRILSRNQRLMKTMVRESLRTNQMTDQVLQSPPTVTSRHLMPHLPRFTQRPSLSSQADTGAESSDPATEERLLTPVVRDVTRRVPVLYEEAPTSIHSESHSRSRSASLHDLPASTQEVRHRDVTRVCTHDVTQGLLPERQTPERRRVLLSDGSDVIAAPPPGRISMALSASQPHLPSSGVTSQPLSQGTLRRPHSHGGSQLRTQADEEGLQISPFGSINSLLSLKQHRPSAILQDLQDPEVFERLSQIEAEMDACLQDSGDDDTKESDVLLSRDDDVTPRSVSQTDLSRLPRRPSRTGSLNESAVTSPAKPRPLSETSISRASARGARSSGDVSTGSVEVMSSSQGRTSKDSDGDVTDGDCDVTEEWTLNSLPTASELDLRYSEHSGRNSCDVTGTDSPETGSVTSREGLKYAAYERAAADSAEAVSLIKSDSLGTLATESAPAMPRCDDVTPTSAPPGPLIGRRIRPVDRRRQSSIVNGSLAPPLSRLRRSSNRMRSSFRSLARRCHLTSDPSQPLVDRHIKEAISKRTATNERKASKVLGIIFAVFVVLWTPFFVLNILSVVCPDCLATISPTIAAAIVWLGYLSSLANPIIYTMFNTAFRRAFLKIVRCGYRCRRDKRLPESIHMTNHITGWGSDRRCTVTVTFNQ